jgi:hypothetical protein
VDRIQVQRVERDKSVKVYRLKTLATLGDHSPAGSSRRNENLAGDGVNTRGSVQ